MFFKGVAFLFVINSLKYTMQLASNDENKIRIIAYDIDVSFDRFNI